MNVEDPVHHPKHYRTNASGIETIRITEQLNFNVGNAVKYAMRHQHKGNPTQDMEKCIWYINREINRRFSGSWPHNSSVTAKDKAYDSLVFTWCANEDDPYVAATVRNLCTDTMNGLEDALLNANVVLNRLKMMEAPDGS